MEIGLGHNALAMRSEGGYEVQDREADRLRGTHHRRSS